MDVTFGQIYDELCLCSPSGLYVASIDYHAIMLFLLARGGVPGIEVKMDANSVQRVAQRFGWKVLTFAHTDSHYLVSVDPGIAPQQAMDAAQRGADASLAVLDRVDIEAEIRGRVLGHLWPSAVVPMARWSSEGRVSVPMGSVQWICCGAGRQQITLWDEPLCPSDGSRHIEQILRRQRELNRILEPVDRQVQAQIQ